MLSASIDHYLRVRRAAGYQLEGAEVLLRSFERFALRHRLAHVQTALACQWARQAPSPQQRDLRLDTVRRFARFAASTDPRHQVPPAGFFGGRRSRPLPYIYSPREVKQLLGAALRLGRRGELWPRTFHTLLSLLYVTGLRISEAIHLRLPDLCAEGLLVRRTKFRKSRLLPLHPSARRALEHYLRLRSRSGLPGDHIFLSKQGRPLTRQSAAGTFRTLVASLGLRQAGRPGPRLHSFRHGFAVRVLEQSPTARDQVGRHLLALSTYLGHSRVADTYWYLEATPPLMKDIRRDLERFLEGGVR